jgi:YHS domain-containing protein
MMTTAFLVLTLAQTPTAPSQPPTTASAEVMQCAQAQMIVDQLLDAADARIELARQSNSPADMRAAVDALQATMRDVRAQLAPCANVQPPPDPHLGHVTTPATPMPTAPGSATPKPPAAADPHAGHTMAPVKPEPAPAKPAAPRAPGATPAKPAAADPHAGHTMTPAKPAPAKREPAKAAPPAADPHAGHAAPPAKPAPPAKRPPAQPSAPAAGTAKPPAQSPAQAVDPVCGLKVDPETAPSATHNGRAYHFCSDQHRELFQKNPAKFIPRQE